MKQFMHKPHGEIQINTAELDCSSKTHAAVAWMNGLPEWKDHCIVMKLDDRSVVLDANLVNQTQQSLKLRFEPEKKAECSPSHHRWKKQTSAKLAEYSWLASQAQTKSLFQTVCGATRGDRHSREELVRLLAAEAVCVNRMPISPAQTILRLASPPVKEIQQLVLSPATPTVVKGLAAMVLGGLHMTMPSTEQVILFETEGIRAVLHLQENPTDEREMHYLRLCFQWGCKRSIPETPAFVLHILKDFTKLDACEEFLRSLPIIDKLRLPLQILGRYLLRHGSGALVELCEVLQQFAPLIARAYSYEDILPNVPNAPLSLADDCIQSANEFCRGVGGLVVALLLKETAPHHLALVARFIEETLLRIPPLGDSIKHLRSILFTGFEPEPIYGVYLQLLCNHHAKLLQTGPDKLTIRRARTWLKGCAKRIAPLHNLVHKGLDVALLERLVSARELKDFDVFCRFTPEQLAGWCEITDRLEIPLGAFEGNQFLSIVHNIGIKKLIQIVELIRSSLLGIPFSVGYRAVLIRRLLYGLGEGRISDLVLESLPALIGLITAKRGNPRSFLSTAEWLAVHCSSDFTQRMQLLLSNDLWFTTPCGCANQIFQVCAILTPGNTQKFGQLCQSMHRCHFAHNALRLLTTHGLESLAEHPQLHETLLFMLEKDPQRTLSVMIDFCLMKKFFAIKFADVERILESEPSSELSEEVSQEWCSLTQFVPAAIINRFLHARRFLGQSTELPKSLRTKLHPATSAHCQLNRIGELVCSCECERRRRLEVRCERLSARLKESIPSIRERQQIQASMVGRLHYSRLSVLELCIYRACASVSGLPANVVPEHAVKEATLMQAEIMATYAERELDAQSEPNLALLKAVIQHHGQDEEDFRRHLPGNIEFLRKLGATGVNVDLWQSDYRRDYEVGGDRPETVQVFFETRPIEILKMGSYLNTCLGRYGKYVHDVVPNAVDLNKKVVYVTEAGKIIARKVIAVNTELQLVGYPVYWRVRHERKKNLRKIINDHCIEFARQVNLTLGYHVARVEALSGYQLQVDDLIAWKLADA